MCCFFFNDTATTEIYTDLHTRSLHDALPIYSTLAMLGRVLGETHERYCMTALLLAEERRAVLPLKREKFEEDCRLLAERMAILTGRDAPEFFDKALFKGYLNTLIEIGLVSVADRSEEHTSELQSLMRI